MPWSDDTRCLYCDGKLPLFRKLAHGQFCSKAHQKKYWDEQQHLAVERLHQTHSDIQAYKPPEPIENILGPMAESDFSYLAEDAESILGTTEPAPVRHEVVENGPAMAGFVAQMLDPIGGGLSPFLATGSLEFEPALLRPETPVWAAPGAAGATLRLRAVADYVWAWAERFADAPRRAAAGYEAIEAALDVERPSNSLTVVPLVVANEVTPALERQFEIAGPVPFAGSPAIQANDPTPLVSAGNITHAAHRWTALRVRLGSSEEQFSIPESMPQTAAIAPQGMMMVPAVLGAPKDLTLPVMPARLSGPAFEVPTDYEPPLVERLRALGGPVVQVPVVGMRFIETLADHGHNAAGRPEIGLSNRLVTSAACNALAVAGLGQLVGGIPSGAYGRPNGDPQPVPMQALEAAQPEPKLIGAPLAPDSRGALVRLPWSLEISASPVFDATPSRALTPNVTAMLPTESGSLLQPVAITPAAGVPAAVLSESLEAAAEVPTIEGPIDIPALAGHLAMRAVLTVSPAAQPAKLPGVRSVIPEPLAGQQMIPKLRMEPVPVVFATASAIELETAEVPGAVIEAAKHGALAGIRDFWKQAPRDLKLLACAVPILIGLAFHSLPTVSVSAPESSGFTAKVQQAWTQQVANLKQTVAHRAAIALDEDFRGGIDHWVSGTGATAEWSFDSVGFVHPGPLALYEPSLKLADYQMQFLGMIDEKSMSWVTRAQNFENYYVIKLVVLKPGPLPTIGMTRYAVINGKPVDRVDRPVAISARPDTIYRVRMDVHGSNYALEVQGQMVDSWSEPRLVRGGVGFFTGRGEKSSIRWVQLTHQYDVLGRLCAYLAPYEF